MRSMKISLALTMVAGTWLFATTGCGGSDSTNNGGSGGATGGTGGTIVGTGGTGATGTGATGGTTTGGTGGTGGTVSDGNDTRGTASPISIGTDPQTDSVVGSLDPVDSDIDYYKFSGTAGQILNIITAAKPQTDPFDATYLDLVVTVYDSTGKQIAEQDDPNPRSSNDPLLFLELPSTGDFYVRVVECNKWEKGGSLNCAPASDIVNKQYSLYISEVDFTQPGTVKETEPNNDAATAQDIPFAPNANSGTGSYYLSTLYATFADQNDTDVYSFTVPSDLAVDSGARATMNFYPQEPFDTGDGSTTQPGVVYLADASNPTAILAQVDVSKGGSLDVPVTVGTKYLAFYKRAGVSGAHDYYFDLMGVGSGNPVETQETPNNTASTAEVLTASTGQPGSYFVEGNLTSGDVDHFSVTVPGTAAAYVNVACGAMRSGSGLTGFKAEILKGDGTPMAGASATETDTEDLLIKNIQPGAETKLIIKVSATGQSSTVSSDYYRCGIHFNDKQLN